MDFIASIWWLWIITLLASLILIKKFAIMRSTDEARAAVRFTPYANSNSRLFQLLGILIGLSLAIVLLLFSFIFIVISIAINF